MAMRTGSASSPLSSHHPLPSDGGRRPVLGQPVPQTLPLPPGALCTHSEGVFWSQQVAHLCKHVAKAPNLLQKRTFSLGAHCPRHSSRGPAVGLG